MASYKNISVNDNFMCGVRYFIKALSKFFGTVLHVLYKLLVDKIPTVHVT